MTNTLKVASPKRKQPNPDLIRTSKVLIVDDHELVRDGLRQLIGKQQDLEVCGECSTFDEAKQQILAKSPDIVVADLRLKDSNGLDLLKWITERRPDVKVLVCSMHSENAYGERALRLGAKGFVSKVNAKDLVVTGIREILSGRLFFSEELTQQIMRRSGPCFNGSTDSQVLKLSDRELEVLNLLGEGLTSEQIAERLFLSRNTIGTYRERLKIKLQLKNCSELSFFAIHWVEGLGTKNGTSASSIDASTGD